MAPTWRHAAGVEDGTVCWVPPPLPLRPFQRLGSRRHAAQVAGEFFGTAFTEQELHALEKSGDKATEKLASVADGAEPLTFVTRAGKEHRLCGESQECCIAACKKLPDLQPGYSEEKNGNAAVDKLAEGGPGQDLEDCEKFCKSEFQVLCFPGSATVLVHSRGRVAMAELRIGDAVLAPALQPTTSKRDRPSWCLRFQPVVAFLHREPGGEAEMLSIRHSHGSIELTANHLIFVSRAEHPGEEGAMPIFAEEVSVGDRVLAPWLDGTLIASEVLSIDRCRRRGLFAPLLPSGMVLVDGTVASCYALPTNISGSALFRCVSSVADPMAMQALYHALFLPLRLLRLAQQAELVDSAASPHGKPATHGKLKALLGGGILERSLQRSATTDGTESQCDALHPYARLLYELFSRVAC